MSPSSGVENYVYPKMFELRKRQSMTLRLLSYETEEFRRVAVRRRTKAADDHDSQTVVSSGVCGSYSREGNGDEPLQKRTLSLPRSSKHPEAANPAQTLGNVALEEGLGPVAGPSLNQPASSPGAAQRPSREGTEPISQGDKALLTNLDPAGHCPHPSSPAGRQRSGIVNGAGEAFISPARTSPEAPSLGRDLLLGINGPARWGPQDGSSLGGGPGGHTPARLSLRGHAPNEGRLRTPSPVLRRTGSYSPFRCSRSWLGQRLIPSTKMDRLTENSVKRCSVPQLVVHLDENSPPIDALERSPLKPLPSANGTVSSTSVEAVARAALSCTTGLPVGHFRGLPSDLTGCVAPGQDPAFLSAERGGVGGRAGDGARGGEPVTSTSQVMTPEEGRMQKDFVEEERRRRSDCGGGEERGEKLFKVATELQLTERAYVARLHLLHQVFYCRLSEEAGRGSFPVVVVRDIFSNISSIHSFHSQFLLPDLEERMQHWRDRPGLGDVMLRHAPFLRLYAEYVRNFNQAMALISTWRERSAAFRNIIQEIQSLDVCGGLGLEHHMLEPVQRVPRYQLLLKDYLRNLPADDPDHPLAQKALETIAMAAGHSNSAIKRAESLRRLLEIYEMVGEEEILNPPSEFLREGRLLKLAARNTCAMDRHLFLFNHFLLCCTPKLSLVGQRFTVRARITVDGMQVQKTNNEDHPHSFQISGKEKTLELQASSDKDRDEWIKVIQEAIDLFQQSNESFNKSACKESDVEVVTVELGRRAPRWIRDNTVTVCMRCQESFSAITRRRHHCRACGCVVCWKCSDHKVALEYDGNKLNKVCNACYAVLVGGAAQQRADGKRQSLNLKMASDSSPMSSFLLYSDDPNTCQRVWSVIPLDKPHALHLYKTPQGASPVRCIPLLGCSVAVSPGPTVGLQSRFSLRCSSSSHVFLCDGPELRRCWLEALQRAGVAAALPSDNAHLDNARHDDAHRNTSLTNGDCYQ